MPSHFNCNQESVLARTVRNVDNVIHRINHYPADSMVCFVNTYPPDSNLYSKQLGPVVQV